jgi:hypothetical protein
MQTRLEPLVRVFTFSLLYNNVLHSISTYYINDNDNGDDWDQGKLGNKGIGLEMRLEP